MTFESANFKMSETGESENLPECTMEETPPPCCTTDTEDCHISSQVKIQIQHLWSFTLQLLPCLISSYPFPLIMFCFFKQSKSDGQPKKKLKVGLQLNLIIKTLSLSSIHFMYEFIYLSSFPDVYVRLMGLYSAEYCFLIHSPWWVNGICGRLFNLSGYVSQAEYH